MTRLAREIRQLEGQLGASSAARDELVQIRRGLGSGRAPAIELPNLRIGFACNQRWEDMIGDDRVRACRGCDRPVFNLSEMTRAEAEEVLATRGLTPCVRFYRRPDGTIMTTDCPTRPRAKLGVVAGSIAAGAALAVPGAAHAEPPAPLDGTTDAPADAATAPPAPQPVAFTEDYLMGLPPQDFTHEMGGIEEVGAISIQVERFTVEWSTWVRGGGGIASRAATPTLTPTSLARRLTPPAGAETAATGDAALGGEVTFPIARRGVIRAGAWGELRTTSGPVAGGEIVVGGLPPHPIEYRISGAGSLVLRAGGNEHVVTGQLGFGYVGAFPHPSPRWVPWAQHVVGGGIVVTMNRSLDDPRDWSATLDLEVEPLGLAYALYRAMR